MATVVLAALLTACAHAPGPGRDVLWRIVSECVEASGADYCSRCRWPVEGACPGDRTCRDTIDVWALTPDYVAIRDVKMCGCPPGFVHGLALPRTRVTGDEDPHRPDGIWAFAWNVARRRIADEREIAMVVNPPGLERTQNQLHVHLVRLLPGARARLAAAAPAHAADLDQVWAVASAQAGARRLDTYGVLVARGEAGGFAVRVQAAAPEEQFTAAVCR